MNNSNSSNIATNAMFRSQTIKDLDQYSNVMFVLCMGQSLIGNHANNNCDAYEYTAGSSVFNYYNGQLKTAQSPAKEEWNTPDDTKGHFTSGIYSTYLPELGDKIIAGTSYDCVVFVNISVGGSTMNEWTPNSGPYSRVDSIDNFVFATGLFERVNGPGGAVEISKMFNREYTHILWQQGESDNCNGTSTNDYKTMFVTLKNAIRAEGINAPIYIARSAFIDPNDYPECDTPELITDAQNQLISEHSDIFEGIDSDSLDLSYRCDYGHYNTLGCQTAAQMWVDKLTT